MRFILRYSVMCFATLVLLVSCVSAPGKERGKVLCPACGTEFDALYEKRF